MNEDDKPILSLSAARSKKCGHMRIVVSNEEHEVVCGDCNTRLNPIGVLLRLANDESRLKWQIHEAKRLREEREYRSSAKCVCGRMVRFQMKPRALEPTT